MFFMPTLLAFREGPAIIRTFELFENKPDVLMIDGDGILHPYGCGQACYVGVALKKNTIGISKKLLFGNLEGDKIYVKDKNLGFRMRTKD